MNPVEKVVQKPSQDNKSGSKGVYEQMHRMHQALKTEVRLFDSGHEKLVQNISDRITKKLRDRKTRKDRRG